MNHELNKLQLEEFIEKSLLDIKSRLQDTLSIAIVQLDCCQNRKKRIKEEIELYEKTMEYEGLKFDNITPLEDKTISIRDINKQISKEMKEKDHGTPTA
tara:strand:- start:58 stop:354 length:297 start_codon:yes stop_codon:yes gene_type:complete